MVIHLCSPRILYALFCCRDACARLAGTGNSLDADRRGINADFSRRVSHTEHVGRRSSKGGTLQFLHLHNPRLCIKNATGNNFTSQFLRSIVSGPEGNKYIVAKGDKHTVRIPVTLGIKNIGPAFCPPFPILPRVGLVHRGTCGTACLSELSHLLQGNGQHIAIGERRPRLHVSQHTFVRFRHLLNVVVGLDIPGFHARFFIKLFVERRVVICPLKSPLELLDL
ncbi:MAG: hypothetical protein A4E62_03165 [Syntrophorhabdus sp. PtaU1.Bin002]|nr:MAG: hypothetical protein A4E62_03165 [Syntrophorhabdus sp. PtaU1.Bin002]